MAKIWDWIWNSWYGGYFLGWFVAMCIWTVMDVREVNTYEGLRKACIEQGYGVYEADENGEPVFGLIEGQNADS